MRFLGSQAGLLSALRLRRFGFLGLGTLAHIITNYTPQHPKYLKNEVLGFQSPVISGLLDPKTLEYEVFELVNV